MAPSLQLSRHLYLLKRQTYERFLAPGIAGVLTPIATDGQILRSQYIGGSDELESHLAGAKAQLELEHCSLLFSFVSADGPPLRTARIFVYKGRETISWQENSYIHHGDEVLHFHVPGPNSGYGWEGDARLARYGWLLTGLASATSLWRVTRHDIDPFGSIVLTLAPVRPPVGLPTLDLSRMSDVLLRSELAAQYAELPGSLLRHAYRDVVSKARNIVEGLLRWTLIEQQIEPGRDLFEHLNRLRSLVESRTGTVSDLSYHLAHKIRLLHTRTHPAQVSATGRQISPELALTVIEDLKEIVADLRFVAA